ncbi:DUF6314 family protein [Sedimentitalea nanhaiensis]|uniref:DUF6314 domain-containing protein n=1 Tax=Sedimentitalea nanhaiensis TaxID=999627 RepID=A0A1I6ZVQ6_9RHOB|nr:DUF6314 family protein [Sedimentitalea nanhaiensis]SFT66759.1 hypothetical protein SAMN05216236_10511 [Sedimentitalea nanhaiensis]
MDGAARQLLDFQGAWHLEREITHADGTRARFVARAVWTPQAQGLGYVENGELKVQGHVPISASQNFSWRADLSVWFSDGRYFHTVPARGGPTSHWCDPDQYDGAYDFDFWPVFTVTWQVSGPRKSYRMISTYHRI